MKSIASALLSIALLALTITSLTGCPPGAPVPGLQASDFERITENGFEAEDNRNDLNDYPWSMAAFGDSLGRNYLYVGTGNGIGEAAFATLLGEDELPTYPAEIRRYRPDIGPRIWETVLDFRDVSDGPPWPTTGVRSLIVYDDGLMGGQPSLYAGTVGEQPSLWRTTNGIDWEFFWSSEDGYSIRGVETHDGLLYFTLSGAGAGIEPSIELGPGRLFATDGVEVWQVIGDGFGDPDNRSIWSVQSFNGALYCGTFNAASGFEVWKLDTSQPEIEATMIIDGGAGDARNTAAGSVIEFDGSVYFGTLTVSSENEGENRGDFKPPIIVRVNADDTWETVVGENSIGGVPEGFGEIDTSYIWSLMEHDGLLYAGTWGFASDILYTLDILPELITDLPQIIRNRFSKEDLKRQPNLLSELLNIGCDLWKSPDGVTWSPVFTDGLGNPYNNGIRNMLSTGDEVFLGLANPFEGLEVWRAEGATED